MARSSGVSPLGMSLKRPRDDELAASAPAPPPDGGAAGAALHIGGASGSLDDACDELLALLPADDYV